MIQFSFVLCDQNATTVLDIYILRYSSVIDYKNLNSSYTCFKIVTKHLNRMGLFEVIISGAVRSGAAADGWCVVGRF